MHTLDELIAAGKANPGKVNFAAAQTHSVPHLTGEVLSRITGLNLYIGPYSGSPAAMTALIAGEVAVIIDGIPALAQRVRAGTFRALAVTSPNRLPGYESVPAVAEIVPGFESMGWSASSRPRACPRQ